MNLLQNSVAANTANVYENAISIFEQFRYDYGLARAWPPTLSDLINFLAFLAKSNYSPSTARSYISGISFYLKVSNLHDATNSFIVKKMLSGMQRLSKRCDCRKPITLEILTNIIHILPSIAISSYESALFAAAFTLAFFAFLRVGEFADSGYSKRHALCYDDVLINCNKNILYVTLHSSKTDQFGHQTKLEISKHDLDLVCPVFNMLRYLRFRPKIDGLLFRHLNSKPLTRYQVSAMLKKAIRYLGLHENDYNTHSFRIGAATSAALMGKSDEEIMKLGRWNSISFKKYIRLYSFN